MMISFANMEEKVIQGLRGGEGEARVKQYADKDNRILKITLAPGASIGMHTHETDSETLLILSGQGTMYRPQGNEPAPTGSFHYCPRGEAHSLKNTGSEPLVLFAVIPTHQQ